MKRARVLLIHIVFRLILTLGSSCNILDSEVNNYNKTQYEIVVTANPNGGYGYDIYINNELYINQPFMPGIATNKGFASYNEARIVARFIINKIIKKQIPPTISLHELDSLKTL